MTHRTDFAKTTIQGHSEQQIRFPHLHQLWRCSTKFKTLHSYKTTVYTIFRSNLSFQLWESAKMSSPDQREEETYAPLSEFHETAGSTVTAKSDFGSRTKMALKWSNGEGCRNTCEECLLSWHFPTEIPGVGVNYSMEGIKIPYSASPYPSQTLLSEHEQD